MEGAWLDSLSEDWVSQPRSSGSPAPSLPSLSNSTSDSSNVRAPASRIPKYNPRKQVWTPAHDSSTNALAERSPNDNNIPLSQRAGRRNSKLRDEISNSTRGRLSRASSISTTNSNPIDTIHHNQSVSRSPKKGYQDTPEWKKRLLQGDVAYGEQRDLFSPAGLENIFRPPPSNSISLAKLSNQNIEENSIVIPSSPPSYNVGEEDIAESIEDDHGQNRQQPRAMKYKLTDQPESAFSMNNLSRSSSFHPMQNFLGEEQEGFSDPGSNFESSVVHQQLDGERRFVSGQSDIRNEELSPIYVARHDGGDGKVDYAALDLSAGELQERLESLQTETEPRTDDPSEISLALPGNTTGETEDFAHNGRFVNLRRGGRSQEGSFHRRMLSPSSLPAIDESAMLPEESMQASTPKDLPNIKKTRPSNDYAAARTTHPSPSVPETPHPSPSKLDDKGKGSSGSPLKLFGTYDTFTNQTLLRRLSQFEEHFDGEGDEDMPSTSCHESTRPELNDAFVAQSSPEKRSQRSQASRHEARKVNSFGEGDLDGFQFSEEISCHSDRSQLDDEDKENLSLPVLDPSTQTKFKFQLNPSLLEAGVLTHGRLRTINTTSTTKHTVSVRRTARPGTGSSDEPVALPSPQMLDGLATPRKRNGDSGAKRLPKSPLKYPTPKRRRTLRESEVGFAITTVEDVEQDSLKDTHQQMQSVIGKKRKDARHDDDQQAANPKVLAMRQILRPRTPTPSQRSSQQRERAPFQESELASTERARLLREEKIAKIQAELDSADPLKTPMVPGLSQQMYDESRKGSVTTQDFLDEAKKIMAGIRGKNRPRSGLTSLEESESENDRNVSMTTGTQNDELEDSYQESTKEPFSRPPSREGGGPLPRLPLKQQDPAILDHLRKYEEMSDMDEIIASSMKSIAMAKDAAVSAREIDRITNETISRAAGRQLSQGHHIESDPPNIRISENPESQRKRKHSSSSAPTHSDELQNFNSQGSNGSSGQSTTHSIPTGSSRGSDSRRNIAPHTVSHLIPEQLAGMVFDRERNIWVKRKTVSAESRGLELLPSDETDDDPFGDIPDLSVDETQELQRIMAVAARRREEEKSFLGLHGGENAANMGDEAKSNGMTKSNFAPSSELSKPSNVGSSGTTPDTNTRTKLRDDSHQTVARVADCSEGQVHHRVEMSYKVDTVEEVVEEVEREISILEDRVDPRSARRRRNVTISFSSPLASIIQPSPYKDENSSEYDREASESENNEADDFENGNGSVIVTKRGNNDTPGSARMRASLRKTSRRLSLGGHHFSVRPVSRIDEQDEKSLMDNHADRRRRSISMVVAAPVATRASSMVLATPRPSHEVGTLELTPLSDFTVHQADESFGLNVSYVADGQRYVSGTSLMKTTLSLSIKVLVEKLTEVEPYEPFWEHMKQMDLRDKKLTSLHKLDEFCEQLEELDVSRNQLSQLNGAPPSVRHLRITNNYLSDLSAWGHLGNLQYIDVSNNQIESLSAFKYLVHLRGLRADNNKIKSLDGIGHLDGLLNLRLRGNFVESLDFRGTKLHRLSDLDLNDNYVSSIQNIHELSSLSNLSLEGNSLSKFDLEVSEQLSAIKYLRLSGNNLVSVDVSQCPDLRLLYLDRNRLGNVTGFLKTKYLDSFSMREQQVGATIDPSFLSEVFEVRKLFLSGNLFDIFQPRVEFLNLQYLELANCGLESLPMEFGQMLPNLRVLNLNFNALRDIIPLLGIVRLKKLHLAGNRLARLRKTTNVLAQFPTLTSVDLRCNPLTIGFYPPVTDNQLVVRKVAETDETTPLEPFTLGKGDPEKDERYASRLDMETRMLRRVYEMLIVGGCSRLKKLDGMRANISILEKKDKVWGALIEAGVVDGAVEGEAIRDGSGQVGPMEVQLPEEKVAEKPILEEQWQAEDSFA